MNAVIAGSFDPVTVGHLDLIRRAAAMFDKVTVLLMNNTADAKQYCFAQKTRFEMLLAAVSDMKNVRAEICDGLLSEYCRAHGAVIVKGVRNGTDYDYEAEMAHINRALTGVDTVLLCADPKFAHVSSTVVRELLRYGGDPRPLLPEASAQICIDAYRK